MGIGPISIYPVTVNRWTMRESSAVEGYGVFIFPYFYFATVSGLSIALVRLLSLVKGEAFWPGLFILPRRMWSWMDVKVAVIMGSKSDWETMKHACGMLDTLEVPYEKKVVSAHRTPDLMFRFAEEAKERGLEVIIAGAGGAAHLPGMVAAKTIVPVIGVPVQSKALNGLDSLLSIVQMPAGVPVATVAIGESGAKNAALLAAQILAAKDSTLAERIQKLRNAAEEAAIESSGYLE